MGPPQARGVQATAKTPSPGSIRRRAASYGVEITGDLWLTAAVLIAVIISAQVTREMFRRGAATWKVSYSTRCASLGSASSRIVRSAAGS